MFGKKKASKKKKGKEAKNNSIQDISSNQILVRVYKDFGSNTQIMKANYEATEQRDTFNNLISINEKFSHNEDTDFAISDVYREMQIILEFKNKPLADRLKVLQEKIDRQDKLLRYLEAYPTLNAIYNYCDEDLKSRDYKILKNFISHQTGEGAYFTIENGKRVYSFMACDGYLAPIWHGIDRYTQYPDHTRKLKITVQEDMRMKEEIKEYLKSHNIHSILKWLAVIVLIFFLANCVVGWWLYEKHVELDDRIHASAYKSANYMTELNKIYGDVIKDKLIDPYNQQIKAPIKELSPDTVG